MTLNNSLLKSTEGISFWEQLTRPHPLILILLIFCGLLIQLNIQFFDNISYAYTHFYYLIIVLAGLWYQKQAIWIALLFSGMYLLMELLPPFSLSFSSIFRVCMLCLVAIVVGSITDRLIILQNGLRIQNEELQSSQRAFEISNRKLNMLSSITRHDILNQIMVLRSYLEMSKEIETDPEISSYLEKGDIAAHAIEHQISFTRYYQNIGVQAPTWQNVEEYIRTAAVELRIEDISIDILFSQLEIYADQLIQKVFYNLMENSLRHGEHVTQMIFSFQKNESEGVLVYQDNGIGISEEDKKNLFKRGFGKHTGLGLFLSQEILSITDINIQETGEQGQGVRFEIHIPIDKYRFNVG